jgi:hypothetical protein
MIQMVVRIIPAGVMADPLVIFRVNVRGLRMALLIAKCAPLIVGWRFRRRCADRRRPVRGNTAAANAVLGVRGMPAARGVPSAASATLVLGEHGKRKQ